MDWSGLYGERRVRRPIGKEAGMKTYRALRSFPRAGEAVCAITVMDGWQGARVAYPLRPMRVSGETRPVGSEWDWGYAGTAPRELARALLSDCFGRKWAACPDVCEALMGDVVAALAKPGWEISERDLAAWAHAWALHHGERDLASLAEILYVRLSGRN